MFIVSIKKINNITKDCFLFNNNYKKFNKIIIKLLLTLIFEQKKSRNLRLFYYNKFGNIS